MQPVLLSGLMSRRSKNVIRPVIDWAAPAGVSAPLLPVLRVATPFPWFRLEGCGAAGYFDAGGACLGILEG